MSDEILVCDKCKFTMPYGPDVPETPCPEGYEHDWAYPNMIRVPAVPYFMGLLIAE